MGVGHELRQNKDTMSTERRQRLDSIGFIWDPHQEAWEEGFAALTTFKAREGDCKVSISHAEGTFRLGRWVSRQRAVRDSMSTERQQRLDEIGFIWEPFADDWEEGFAALRVFKAREGHCGVRKLHIEGTFKLGQWVDRQRQPKTKISPERRQRLDEIGFVWDPHESAWEEGFAALTTFKAREDHCCPLQRHVEGSFKRGKWVNRQRVRRDSMSAEHRQRLDEICFIASKIALHQNFFFGSSPNQQSASHQRDLQFLSIGLYSYILDQPMEDKMNALKSLTFTTLPSQSGNPILIAAPRLSLGSKSKS